METITKKVSELIPYVNNPRNNDDAVDAVASSIKNFGFKVPIVVDSNNEIINGHTRLKAAKKLGLETVPVIVADDLTPEQIKAFRLADNKVGEIATWTDDMLAIELGELSEIDFTVVEGIRTKERQVELVKQGKSKTMNSMHLKRLAIDLNFFVDGELVYDHPKVIELGTYWESLDSKNQWGGFWTTFRDYPHFQRTV